MPRHNSHSLSATIVAGLAQSVKSKGLRATSRATGVPPRTIGRALAGERVSDRTATALARIAPKVRQAEEFRAALRAERSLPTRTKGTTSWSLATIRAARDDQLRGVFALPVQLAEALRTDDALYVAYHNRLAPQSSIQTRLVPAGGARGEAVARSAASSVHVSRGTLEGLLGTMANHGVAIGHIEHEPNEEGTRIDFRLTEWPLEFVKWDSAREVLITRTRTDPVDIIHGDGEWIIFRKFQDRPWAQEAAVIPASFVWAAHAEGLADWNATTRAHGLARVVGELPEGVSLSDGSALTEEAQAFLDTIQAIVTGDSVAGIRPAGSKTEWVAHSSGAWQVFAELITNREKAAARIYLGTDAMLGSVGGAPGVDIATLFGVASTKVQSDLTAIETGLATGLYAPWCAVNHGDSRYAPRIEYQMPDPDETAKRDERRAAFERLVSTVREMREQRLEVTQDTVNQLAGFFGVDPVPRLASAGAPA